MKFCCPLMPPMSPHRERGAIRGTNLVGFFFAQMTILPPSFVNLSGSHVSHLFLHPPPLPLMVVALPLPQTKHNRSSSLLFPSIYSFSPLTASWRGLNDPQFMKLLICNVNSPLIYPWSEMLATTRSGYDHPLIVRPVTTMLKHDHLLVDKSHRHVSSILSTKDFVHHTQLCVIVNSTRAYVSLK